MRECDDHNTTSRSPTIWELDTLLYSHCEIPHHYHHHHHQHHHQKSLREQYGCGAMPGTRDVRHDAIHKVAGCSTIRRSLDHVVILSDSAWLVNIKGGWNSETIPPLILHRYAYVHISLQFAYIYIFIHTSLPFFLPSSPPYSYSSLLHLVSPLPRFRYSPREIDSPLQHRSSLVT